MHDGAVKIRFAPTHAYSLTYVMMAEMSSIPPYIRVETCDESIPPTMFSTPLLSHLHLTQSRCSP